MRPHRLYRGGLITLALLMGRPWPLPAQEMDVPANIQIPLLYKILTFDRNLQARMGDDIVIAIIFQTGYRASVVAKEQVEEAGGAANGGVAGRKVRWIALELGEMTDLGAVLRQRGVDVIYVAPLRGVGLSQILHAARAGHVTTFTGVAQYVERGIAIGIGLERERPQIMINLEAARAEGSEYNSQLLRVSRVMGEDR